MNQERRTDSQKGGLRNLSIRNLWHLLKLN